MKFFSLFVGNISSGNWSPMLVRGAVAPPTPSMLRQCCCFSSNRSRDQIPKSQRSSEYIKLTLSIIHYLLLIFYSLPIFEKCADGRSHWKKYHWCKTTPPSVAGEVAHEYNIAFTCDKRNNLQSGDLFQSWYFACEGHWSNPFFPKYLHIAPYISTYWNSYWMRYIYLLFM